MLSFSHAKGFPKTNMIADDVYMDIGGRKICKIASTDFFNNPQDQYMYINPLYKILKTDIDYLTNCSDILERFSRRYI